MKLHRSILFLIPLLALMACEDLPPTNAYQPEYIVEGYLFVGEPIRGIVLTKSQSVTDTFRYAAGGVSDATVTLDVDGRTLPLLYRATPDGPGEYYYADTTEVVKPESLYSLSIRTSDGATLGAKTRTPAPISWIREPLDTLQYPSDTINLSVPDTLRISWTTAPGVTEYLVSVRSLDTANYGSYLVPPTEEKNRRIERFFEENSPDYPETIRYGYVQSNDIPISWVAFKWFGVQEVMAYAAAPEFLDWFKLTHFQQNPQYDGLSGNVTGGIGIFTSASVARKRVFVLKNQP
jgi:hypothetical protein